MKKYGMIQTHRLEKGDDPTRFGPHPMGNLTATLTRTRRAHSLGSVRRKPKTEMRSPHPRF